MMTAQRAVEAMLAEIGYRKGTLRTRIIEAVREGKMPDAMAEWADEVRIYGNESHTSGESPDPLPDADDAKHALTFSWMLAEYLFVLPARIKRAREPDAQE